MIRVIATFVALFLASCGVTEAVPKIVEVIKDPGVPVGEPSEQPTVINLHAYAAADVNNGFDGEPKPIIVKVFALSSDHRFFSYDFFTLVESFDPELGITMTEFLDENQLEPDSYKILGPYELPKRTKKIGVIAEYYDIDSSVWRTSINVEDVGADDRLLLLLLQEEVRLVKETE